MTVHVTFSENSHRFLHTLGERYPYAFGYLAGQVQLFLDGHATREHLQAVLHALEAELDGERQ
jgi:hypothetical protein